MSAVPREPSSSSIEGTREDRLKNYAAKLADRAAYREADPIDNQPLGDIDVLIPDSSSQFSNAFGNQARTPPGSTEYIAPFGDCDVTNQRQPPDSFVVANQRPLFDFSTPTSQKTRVYGSEQQPTMPRATSPTPITIPDTPELPPPNPYSFVRLSAKVDFRN